MYFLPLANTDRIPGVSQKWGPENTELALLTIASRQQRKHSPPWCREQVLVLLSSFVAIRER